MTPTTETTEYAVYVTDDNGWADNCPDSKGVFFGDHAGYVHHTDGGEYPMGEVRVQGLAAAEALLHELETTGDWTAASDEETGKQTRPSYAMRKVEGSN